MAHPLLDRRDMTAARERAPVGEPAPSTSLDAGGLAHELGELCRMLRALTTQERAGVEQLCVTDREPAQGDMRDFPARGARRIIVRRTGTGGLFNLVAGTPTRVVAGNEARLGGSLIVPGPGAVTLYLSHDLLTPGASGAPLTEGVPQLWLAANGGSWDFLLGNLLWCGSVVAVAAADTQVAIAEV